jgi:calcium-dependent protein kinase|tara:strand:- start:3756 stop:5288 length:1533 start_codon:yes stop_codon:yes gene_type:complete
MILARASRPLSPALTPGRRENGRRTTRIGVFGAKKNASAPKSAASKGRVLEKDTPDVKEVFDFGDELGRGQFGAVFAVTEKSSGRSLACKSISKRDLKNEKARNVVRNEVRIMHHLSGDDRVVELIGAYEDATHVHLVMERLDGMELFDAMSEHFDEAPYGERDAAEMTRTIVSAVDYFHQMDVIHRDLKPENFVLKTKAKDAPICAIDFGLSTFYHENQTFTEFVGSPYYMAPEVLGYRYSLEADVWSCGVILYILLSGVPPFWGQTEKATFDAIKRYKKGVEPLDFDSAPWPSVSDEAKELIRGMLELDPKKRLTAKQVLTHPWIADPKCPPASALDAVVFERFKQFAGMTKFKKMGLKAMASNLSADEVAGLKELFKDFDKDGSGTISLDELREGLKLNASEAASAELDAIMAAIDLDGSGELDYEEFIAATLARSKRQSEVAVHAAFDYFDKDGDGSITAEEFEEAFSKMSPVERANLGDVDELIAAADADGDGRIDFDEFMAMMN